MPDKLFYWAFESNKPHPTAKQVADGLRTVRQAALDALKSGGFVHSCIYKAVPA